MALFDLDNTLVDRQAAFERWARRFARSRQLDEGAVELLRRIDGDGFAPRSSVFEALGRQYELPATVEELVADYRLTYLREYRPDPAVQEALTRLRGAGWRIGLVTNGPPTQREKLARAGLADLIDEVCISDELGVAKPDRRIFETALARLGVAAEGAAWMIGDAAVPDIGGGRAAGLATAWVHRGRRWQERSFRPDVVVAGCVEAVDLLLSASPRFQAPSGRGAGHPPIASGGS